MSLNVTWEEEQYLLEDEYSVAVLVINVVSICLILVGNGAVLLLLSLKKNLRTPTNLYIASLCIADITVAVFSVPMEIMKHFTDQDMTPHLCKLVAYFSYMATSSHLFCVVIIAYDRHRVIVYPTLRKLTSMEVLRRVILVWVIALAYGIRSVILFDVVEVARTNDGTLLIYNRCGVPIEFMYIQRRLFILDFLVMYFLPLMITVILYGNIAASLRKTETRQKQQQRDQQQTTASVLQKRKYHILRMLFMVVVVFAVSMLPLHIWRLYVHWGPGGFHGYLVVHQFCDSIAFMNGWLNVVAYILFNPNLRRALFPCFRMNGIVHPHDTTVH